MFRAKLRALFADRYGAPALIRRLALDQGLRCWPQYVAAFALMGISAGATAASAYLIGRAINDSYVRHDFPGVLQLSAIAVLLFAAKGASNYGHTILLARISNRIVADNQRKAFEKLLNESVGFISGRHSSEFVARISAGTAAASQALGLLVTALGRDLLSLIGLAAVMVGQDPLLAIVGLVVAPPALVGLRKFTRRIRGIAHERYTGNVRMLETMQEAIHGIRVVKAFGLEEEMRRRFDDSVHIIEHESNRMARVANRSSPLMETLGGFAVAIVMVYGGHRVIHGGELPGAFFSFITAFLLAYEPAKRLARLNLDLHGILQAVRVLFELIDPVPSEPLVDNRPPLVLKTGRIEFSGVGFGYRSQLPMIRNMSFVAEPGKITALVGPSGGGKSTVLALLLRFYDPQNGTITIDGENIMRVSRRSLRQHIGYVGQHVQLFAGSIRDNIGFGKPGADEAEIIAAAKAAQAHDFIMSFPAGYDTPVGEHGLQLSGGERQRVAIARALVKDAPIILLDEATASLDSESEHQVQEAIGQLCAGRTTLVVAHRLHTIRNADRILVVESGTIVESGRHEELMRNGGRYASFYRLQLKEQSAGPPALAIVASN
jgi:ATP-binding cassette, subfamily B, bacterial MsbA